jgi:CheY-like chemotaxis protein
LSISPVVPREHTLPSTRNHEDLRPRATHARAAQNALPGDQRRAEDAGFDAHLSKPTTVEQLRNAIARAP